MDIISEFVISAENLLQPPSFTDCQGEQPPFLFLQKPDKSYEVLKYEAGAWKPLFCTPQCSEGFYWLYYTKEHGPELRLMTYCSSSGIHTIKETELINGCGKAATKIAGDYVKFFGYIEEKSLLCLGAVGTPISCRDFSGNTLWQTKESYGDPRTIDVVIENDVFIFDRLRHRFCAYSFDGKLLGDFSIPHSLLGNDSLKLQVTKVENGYNIYGFFDFIGNYGCILLNAKRNDVVPIVKLFEPDLNGCYDKYQGNFVFTKIATESGKLGDDCLIAESGVDGYSIEHLFYKRVKVEAQMGGGNVRWISPTHFLYWNAGKMTTTIFCYNTDGRQVGQVDGLWGVLPDGVSVTSNAVFALSSQSKGFKATNYKVSVLTV